MSHITTS